MESFFPDLLLLAIILSLLLNIFIAIAGVVPSTFLTAANILYFGFKYGLVISIIGEALGAVISFFLYRKGVKILEEKVRLKRSSRLIERLKKTNGAEGVLLVLGLRIFPFVPSGLVTLAASISQMKLGTFAIVSTLGKVPALFIEAYSIHTVINMKTEFQIGLALSAILLVFIYYLMKKAKNMIS
ncbi:TVP38/TMEM64 family protein [Mesobacillus maritimus]|uniref:TVP38/TMEM64 family protein n=1 Tax=Mesobacillus maritimus TaxID=1643336 RepID=UPI00384DCBC5